MEPIITLKNVSKEFKVLNRHEGLKGSVKDLFSRDYNIIKAVMQRQLEALRSFYSDFFKLVRG